MQLYRASLNAPAKGKIKKQIYPSYPKDMKLYKLNMRSEGATPKDIKSANESNSFPKLLDTCKKRATLPSYLSIRPANSIKITENLYLASKVIIKDNKPKIKFPKVIIFGR